MKGLRRRKKIWRSKWVAAVGSAILRHIIEWRQMKGNAAVYAFISAGKEVKRPQKNYSYVRHMQETPEIEEKFTHGEIKLLTIPFNTI